ncbi:stromal interaction molecule homolog isoform X2 [Centruroides sculpturatus]|uniref:stromal interaction molecule homolog isoform X2 n=1 Tax=Centruroides sculpturatus TaxID=218467 RepID=UPI000C6DC27C|nr:stromal interaction molecule homolog isoform X2 [Centruroides sculpturatus]
MKLLSVGYFISLLLVSVFTCVLSNQDEVPTSNDIEELDVSSKPKFAISLGPNQNLDKNSVAGEQCEDLDICTDKSGYEAIRTLHRQLDDDANGNIDLEESDEFLRDELQYENGYERHQGFHGNDKYINVDELWQAWKTSEVHNWTVEETVEWLVSYVDLPQYVNTFQNHNVDGTKLPRLAVNSLNFMTIVLGIKDPIHKQKIALKAMDVVLFGPPKFRNYLKDVLLVMCLVIAIGGCWFAYVQHKYSQTHLLKMVKDMECLQNAEESLLELQRELDKARHAQEIVAIEKENLERRLKDEITTAKLQACEKQELDYMKQGRVLQLEDELRDAQEDLKKTKKMLESRPWAPPTDLQNWLQLTHELELRYYNAKKAAAEKQLAAAKEGCEKLRRKRSAFMGAFRIAHGGSIDDVDNRILQAKAALCEITKDLQERLYRWRQIEMLCGFPIVHNPGLLYLETVLKSHNINGSVGIPAFSGRRGSTLARSSSEGTLMHDSPPPYAAEVSAIQELIHNSAALFLVPVPPACRDPLLTSQTGNVSMLSTSLLTSATPTKLSVVNGSLSHYPPPPPSYNTNHRATLSRDHTPEETVTKNLISHAEVNSEEEAEEEEEDTDRSLTPLSSLSINGISEKHEFIIGDSPSDTNSPTNSNPVQNRPLKNIILEHQTDKGVLVQSPSCQSLSSQGDSPPLVSNSSPAEGHKKSLSDTIRQTFSSNNVSKNHTNHSSSSLEEECKKEKKKRQLFSHLRKKKS